MFYWSNLCRHYMLGPNETEDHHDVFGLHLVSKLKNTLAIAFSFNKSRKKAELAEFISGLKEIERHIQRYEYFAERYDTLRLEFCGRELHETEKCLLAEATEELDRLPWQVYERVQSLENYRLEKRGNAWIRRYFSSFRRRDHWDIDREECAQRLGCCAASCGCCKKPRGKRVGPDDAPGEQFIRMARRYLGNRTHCSIDCACCIRRRGFRVFIDEPTKQLKKGWRASEGNTFAARHFQHGEGSGYW